ncbi:MAG: histidine triad protein [Gemmatimonadetes bacterium]|nr:histidine triad protein [Gemmatimonadota bacterium]
MSSCLFCRIASHEIPAIIVAETDDFVAFRDIDPKAPTHILAIPRAHVESLNQATDLAMVGGLVGFVRDVAKQEGVDSSGWRLVVNTNADAGQTVFHVHAHLLGGRSLNWPPG